MAVKIDQLSAEDKQKALLLAEKELAKRERRKWFDPDNAGSNPTPQQMEVLRDFGNIPQQWLVAGNRCLAKGTLVHTSEGAKPIEEIKVGDTVYSENGEPIKVLKTFCNGIKEVHKLTSRGRNIVECTKDHVWLCDVFNQHDKLKGQEQLPTEKLGEYAKVRKAYSTAPMGTVREPNAYVIGALLGDGCCSGMSGRKLYISSIDSKIPSKCANILRCEYTKNSKNNYTWRLCARQETLPHYMEWMYERKAHEKIIDLDVIKTWDRASLVELVAGAFDTDGSLNQSTAKEGTLTWSIGMQAESVIKALTWAIRSLWQIDLVVTTDDRARYKNGCIHIVKSRNIHDIKRMMEELNPHVVSEQKKWKEEYDTTAGGKRSSPERIRLNVSKETREVETYDIHVDSPTNLYQLSNGMITHNSGKSQLAARIISWVLEESHPYWKRPERWGNKPLQIVFAGKNSKIIEEEIWKGKIKRYLEPGTYTEKRSGNQLQSVIMKESGNTLIFQSYENINQARERMQGYTAHLCIVDEMPSSDALISELITRSVTIGGYFLASFTPLLVNQGIRKRVDNAVAPSGKRYKLSMWDNPSITDKAKNDWLVANAHLSEAEIRARIYGDWISPNDAVYYWDADKMLVNKPVYYSHSWRHVLSVDPGSNSPTGMGIFAEDPFTGNWYLMKCWYLTIAEPNALIQKVMELSAPYNIVKRVVDSGYSSWFREIAKLHGLTFSYPLDKTHSRKMELIKQLQFALGGRLFIIDGEDTSIFVDEVTSCHWADSEQAKIAKASRFHVLDMAQYFIDCMPKFEGIPPTQNWWTPIRQAQEEEMNGKVQLKDALQHRKHIDIKKNAVRRKGMGRWPR